MVELIKVSDAIITNGKEVRPAEFKYNEVREVRTNPKIVDMQIERLTAELAKWQEIKNTMLIKADDVIVK